MTKTEKLIERIEDATGGKVAFEDVDGLEVGAQLRTRGDVSLFGTWGCRSKLRAAKALLREVRRRGKAMAKV